MGRLSTIFCLALFVFAASAQRGSKKPSKTASTDDGKIVGGERAHISEFPYLVSLQSARGRSAFCGGSIISSEWILTAAHCTEGQSASGIRVVAGTTHLDQESQVRQVRTIVNHPSYNPSTVDNDIALLKLSSPLTLGGNTRAIPLDRNEFKPSDRLTIAGWGTTSQGGRASRQLLKVTVPGVSRETCKKNYERFGPITNNMVCAGEQAGGKDSCQGDSGGPAVSVGTRKQVGVVSWGAGCAQRGFPGVYANVARYVSWIERQTGLSL